MREIVIVGGGYAGFYAACKLERKLRPSEAAITLIEPRPYMTYQPFLLEVLAGAPVGQCQGLVKSRQDVDRNFQAAVLRPQQLTFDQAHLARYLLDVPVQLEIAGHLAEC